ncbi:dihydropteroate synthase [Saccharicrinis fermentans DSM 9555 = JCM 21142]|uniref:Dihydropteroate synthase n=1 Tax=Saccharicrinis fermentans DSM 9555 = JCM 21142 TaxID=869213 RepID=W7YIJ3_9BACT|nr:dihydropteroate synthase [Saccharicrinis fermentans DSM 9555 = JCM 21142]
MTDRSNSNDQAFFKLSRLNYFYIIELSYMDKKAQYLSTAHSINCNGRFINTSSPLVMGILNITPDSFFDGGKYNDHKFVLKRINGMLEEGADIIDIGAYSSRPGALDITEKEEQERLFSVLELIRNQFPEIILSVDTFRSGIAKGVVETFQVDIINDISAGEMDDKMFSTIAKLNVPYVMMHMKGTPQNMQQNVRYKNDVVFEVIDYLAEKKKRLDLLGVHDVIIDPGFGFGKSLDHNYELLNRLYEFRLLGLPILVGISRKSMIYKLLNSSPQEALNGTTALHMLALEKGANILRVHDVKEAKECIGLYEKLKSLH